MEWNVFDFGKRRDIVEERRAALAQAEENLHRLRDRIEVEVEKSYRKLERAQRMVEVATEVVELRRESDRLTADRLEVGVAVLAHRRESKAALASAEAGMLQADLNWRLARAELDRVVGRR